MMRRCPCRQIVYSEVSLLMVKQFVKYKFVMT